MPARGLAFTVKNILSAWEAVGIFPFNLRRAVGHIKRKEHHVSHSETPGIHIPKTPRAVSRATRTAISLVKRNNPSSQKLKTLLSGLPEGFQLTIADKTVEEEAYRQYLQLEGQEKKAKTTDRRKLTQATVVTSETVIQLREQGERVDAVKAARKVKKKSTQPGPPRNAQMRTRLTTPLAPDTPTVPLTPLPLPSFDEAEDLWEEMEALEVGGDSVAGSSRGGVWDAIRLRGKH